MSTEPDCEDVYDAEVNGVCYYGHALNCNGVCRECVPLPDGKPAE